MTVRRPTRNPSIVVVLLPFAMISAVWGPSDSPLATVTRVAGVDPNVLVPSTLRDTECPSTSRADPL